jgi:hypothetical protein
MAGIAMVGSAEAKDARTMEFSGAGAEEIADKVALFMAERGYRLESGDKLQGVYGRGSAAWGAMLGPLVRRVKFNVTVGKKKEHVAVVIAKGMTGFSGGALGAARLKREFQTLAAGLQSHILA